MKRPEVRAAPLTNQQQALLREAIRCMAKI
jgi:hypothetical protein